MKPGRPRVAPGHPHRATRRTDTRAGATGLACRATACRATACPATSCPAAARATAARTHPGAELRRLGLRAAVRRRRGDAVNAAAVVGRRRTLGPAAVATLLAAVAGAVLGTAVAPDGTRPPAPAAAPRVGLSSGVAKLPLPAGWRPLQRRSELRGLEAATAVRGVEAREVALDIRAPEDASLLPSGVATAGLPAPSTRRLGARAAWRYDLRARVPGAAWSRWRCRRPAGS